MDTRIATRRELYLKEDLACKPGDGSEAANNSAKIQNALSDTKRAYDIRGDGEEYYFTSLTFPHKTGHSLSGPSGSGPSYRLGYEDYGGSNPGGIGLRLTSTLGSGMGAAIIMQGSGGGLYDLVINGRSIQNPTTFSGTRVDYGIRITGDDTPPTGKMRFHGVSFIECGTPVYFSSSPSSNHADSCHFMQCAFQGYTTGVLIDNIQAVSNYFDNIDMQGDTGSVAFRNKNGGDLFVDGIQMGAGSATLYEPWAFSQNTSYIQFRKLRWDTPGAASNTITLVDFTNAYASSPQAISIHGHVAGISSAWASLGASDVVRDFDARTFLVGADGTKDQLLEVDIPFYPDWTQFSGGMEKYKPLGPPMSHQTYQFPGRGVDFTGGGIKTLAATGSTHSDAASVLAPMTSVTGADATKGVILPRHLGTKTITNSNASNALKVYPPSGKTIDYGSSDAAYSLGAHKTAMFLQDGESGNYYSVLGG